MWFKNLQIYRFTRPFDLTVEQLETQLEAAMPSPLRQSGHLPVRVGPAPWQILAPPLTHAASGHLLICARKEEKMLPGTVVKEMLAEKIEAIEFEQGAPSRRREKEALKEEIMHTLLPPAFSRTSQTFARDQPRRQPDGGGCRLRQEGGRPAGALGRPSAPLPVVPGGP